VAKGLPVFRVGGSVRALAADIDRWLAGERLREREEAARKVPGPLGIIVEAAALAETAASCAREEKNRRYALIPLGVEASEYEQLKEKLRAAEEKHQWLLEAVPVWIWETDADGEYTFSNVAVAGILGYRPEELYGFKPEEFVVAEEDAPLYSREMEVLKEKKRVIQGFECRLTRSDGSRRQVEINAVPAFDATGNFAGIRGIARDVTELREAEAALLAEEGSFRPLARNLPGITYRVYIRDNYRMEFFNDMLPTLTGFAVNELEHGEVCSIDPLIVPEDRKQVVAAVKRALAEAEPFEVEYRLRCKDGEVRSFREFGTPIYDRAGRPFAIDGVIFGRTEGEGGEVETAASSASSAPRFP